MRVSVVAITEVLGRADELPDGVRVTDVVQLDSDERLRGHQRVRSRAGRELYLSLPRGSELADGDVLVVEGGAAIVVRAADEDLLELVPRTAREWGLAAWGLGNLHRPARFGDGGILTPYDPAAEALARKLGVDCARVHRSFVGERLGAITGHGHHH